MSKMKELKNKLSDFWQRTASARGKVGRVFREIGSWIYILRGLLLAIPVGVAAVLMAIESNKVLPDRVGLLILENGSYQWMVDKNMAILIPLGVTAACLLMMFCSRKVVYPWLISIFSLVLPLVIYITNVFPA